MKIIAIDTSTAVMGIALLDEHKVYSEIITNLKKNHSVRLMPTLDQLLAEVKWDLQEVDFIAVAKGPGSYTGVRIGVTAAKTLAWALNIPVIGVSTLETMAFANHHVTGLVSPILDARRGQVYTGLYQSLKGQWKNIHHDRIILLSEWLDGLKKENQRVLFIGDDLSIHKEQIIQTLGKLAEFSTSPFNYPRPSIIGWLAKNKYENGNIDNTFDFAPAYLQLAEAEVKWLEKQK